MAKKRKNDWKELAWRYTNLYLIPGKPSEQDKQIYHDFIKESLKDKKNAKALVLGATPSLRNELAKFNVKITLIDISKDIIKALSSLVKHDKTENKINGNWFKMPFKDGYFDIALGDLVLSNVDKAHIPVFLKEIKRILKPEGFLIQRIRTVPSNLRKQPIKNILCKFATIQDKNVQETGFFMCIAHNHYNKKTHEICLEGIPKELNTYRKNKKCFYPDKKVEEMMNFMHKMWNPFKNVWTVGTKKEVFSWVSRYFKIVKSDRASDHYWGKDYPILICSPK